MKKFLISVTVTGLLLLQEQRSNIIPSSLIVLHMAPITQRKCLRPPTPTHSFKLSKTQIYQKH